MDPYALAKEAFEAFLEDSRVSTGHATIGMVLVAVEFLTILTGRACSWEDGAALLHILEKWRPMGVPPMTELRIRSVLLQASFPPT